MDAFVAAPLAVFVAVVDEGLAHEAIPLPEELLRVAVYIDGDSVGHHLDVSHWRLSYWFVGCEVIIPTGRVLRQAI